MKVGKPFLFCWWLSIAIGAIVGSAETINAVNDGNTEEQTCGWEDRQNCNDTYQDAHLKPMAVHLEDGSEDLFQAYVLPDVATFYNKTEGSMRVTETSFNGMMAKFINMRKTPIGVYWKPSDPTREATYIAEGSLLLWLNVAMLLVKL
jgi:hypothetical protein